MTFRSFKRLALAGLCAIGTFAILASFADAPSPTPFHAGRDTSDYRALLYKSAPYNPTPQTYYAPAPPTYYAPTPSYAGHSYGVCDSLGCVSSYSGGGHGTNCWLSTVAGISASTCSTY